jgi:Tol biopolymer transport system component/DNA-binding winged helix-turn-helix (wHTH) protein
MKSLADTASPSTLASECYGFGPFILDIGSRKISRGGNEIALPSRVFDTLAYLIQHRDRIVEKDELISKVWAGTFVSDDSLIHSVSVLRRVLGDDVEHPTFITTLPRRGYRFVCEVTGPSPTVASASATTPSQPQVPAPLPVGRSWGRHRAALVAAGLATLSVALGVVGWSLLRPQPSDAAFGPVLLAQSPPPETTLASGGILSPDGRQLAFVARDRTTGRSRIWVRSIDSANVRAVAGSEDASMPFWSPDGRAIGYFASNKLKIIRPADGEARTIASLSSATGGSWGVGDVIVFGDFASGLSAVSAKGGAVTPLTKVDPTRDSSHDWPHFLPDGRHFLYTIDSWSLERAGVWVGSVDPRGETHRLLATTSPAVHSGGHLLYVENGTLMAESFDAERLELIGEPVPLVRDVPSPTLAEGDIVSVAGTLLSFRGGTKGERLTWFTRDGHPMGAIDDQTALYNPTVSPDGTQVVAAGLPTRNPGLWLVDLKSGASTQLAANGIGPLWSPDGRQIAFVAPGGLDIVISSLLGRADERVLMRDNVRKTLQDWSPDGRYLLYTKRDPQTKLDLWLVPFSDSQHGVPLLTTAANERSAKISPDGRWLAYSSDESGRSEVYVQEFPMLGSKRAVSIGGGAGPSWRKDGGELFYLSPTRALMSVDVRLKDGITLGSPKMLFRAPVPGDLSTARHYAPSPDGQRFLVKVVDETADRTSITVVVNWTAGLKTGGIMSGGPARSSWGTTN